MRTYLFTIQGINIQFIISTEKYIPDCEDDILSIVRQQFSPDFMIDSFIYKNGYFLMNETTYIIYDELENYVI